MSDFYNALEKLQMQRERTDPVQADVRAAEDPSGAIARPRSPEYSAARSPEAGGVGGGGIRDEIDKVLASHHKLDRQFAETGGIGGFLSLCEKLRREVDRVPDQEIDHLAAVTRDAVERLLAIDRQLKKIRDLKRVLGGSTPSEG